MLKSLIPGAIGVRTDLAGALALARAHGFDAIEVPMGEARQLAETEGTDAVAQRFRDAGLRPGSWGLPVDWRGDDAKFQQGLADLPRSLAVASVLGATRVTTVVMSGQNERTREEQRAFVLGRLQPVAARLAEHGCRLGLEFLGPKTIRNRFQHEFIYRAGEMLDLARAIGPNVGLLHDCWHWYTSGGTLEELRRMRGGDIIAVHINDAPPGIAIEEQIDNTRMLPMESGVIDVPGYLRTLQSIGYDGPVGVEPFSARVRALPPDEAVAETAAALDRAWKAAGLG